MQPRLEKSLFFFLSSPSPRPLPPFACRVSRSPAFCAAKKRGEKIGPALLRSAIQCCNLFQFHESPFATLPRLCSPHRPASSFSLLLFFIRDCSAPVNPSYLPFSAFLSTGVYMGNPSPHAVLLPSSRMLAPRACSLIYLVKLSFRPLRGLLSSLRVLVAQVRLIL